MHIRTTTDPITLREVKNPEQHPCVYEGSGGDGLEIYFESEDTRQQYLHMKLEDRKVVRGSDTEDYVPEG